MNKHNVLQEHTYHVLESATKPWYGEDVIYSGPDSRTDSSPSDPRTHTPIYHTIQDERTAEEQLYTQVPLPPSEIAADNYSQELGPVYQHVDELSTYTSNGITTTRASDGKDSLLSSTIVRTTV